MSGYLERLVARHSGPPAVLPRAISRFEGDLVGPAVGPEPAAPVADGVAATATPRAIEPAATEIATGPALAPFATIPVADRSDGVAAQDHMDDPRPLQAVARSALSAATPVASPRRSDGPFVEARYDDPARTRGPERPTVVPVTIRRADPPTLVAATGTSAMQTSRSAAPAPPEPDVVHVHIGRVEVRATVPAREPSRPARRLVRPTPLSLDRYLSGERRT